MHSFYLLLEDVNRCKTLLHPHAQLRMDWMVLIEISNCVVKAVGYMKNDFLKALSLKRNIASYQQLRTILIFIEFSCVSNKQNV